KSVAKLLHLSDNPLHFSIFLHLLASSRTRKDIFSHVGNEVFPRWEQTIPMLGTNYSHAGNNA
ncbi:MAG: hypothetical protein IJ885_02200, partial [Prevotella sp.]|nr:hypothetical protein [Prevotella sp.]